VSTPVFLRNTSSTPVPTRYRNGLVVDLFSQPSRSTVAENLSRLIDVVNPLRSESLDFLLFATAVYVADKKIQRRLASDRWTRDIELNAPVADTVRWEEATPALVEALSFLTGDRWRLEWRREQNRLRGMRRRGHGDFDTVCLFSGGLDSLVGAIDLLEDARRPRILLIGHYDSTLTPRVQRRLANSLARHYGNDRVKLVQVMARPAAARREQRYPLPTGREATTRSRSVMFLGLGMAAASALGTGVPLYVPENGFIALNVPLTKSRQGSCSTRTVHPYFFDKLLEALTGLGLTNSVSNPYQLSTKGEMLRGCKNPTLLRELAPKSVSCAHPELGRYERTGYGDCGYCYPCLIRRAAMHAVDLDEATDYKRDVCTDEALLESSSTRKRDTKAVFAALNDVSRSTGVGPHVALLSGPIPDRASVSSFSEVHRRGLEELRSLFSDKANAGVWRIAGL
jgi:7-cyano-7-deazaguanine synthase in queuosine biosynthesis